MYVMEGYIYCLVACLAPENCDMIQRNKGNSHGPLYNVAFILQRLRVYLAEGCSDLGYYRLSLIVYL